jgi:putative hydrolase of the HAD superfamily
MTDPGDAGRFDAAIFDFGGVLTSPIRASFAAFERELGVPELAILEAFRSSITEGEEPSFFRLERGEISEGDFYRDMHARLCAYLGHQVPFPDDPVEVRRRMFGALERNEPMIEAAHRIAGHYKTAILTNNVKEWTEWRDWVQAHVFDHIIDSSEVGMRKPEEAIYRLTCQRLGVEPSRAVFVDDIHDNVTGAAAVGLHAIHFTDTHEVLEQLRPLFPRAFDVHPKAANGHA